MPFHATYRLLPDAVRIAVDEAFRSMSDELRARGLEKLDNCDHAERLVDAICDYLVASDPTLRDRFRVLCSGCEELGLEEEPGKGKCAGCRRVRADAAAARAAGYRFPLPMGAPQR